MLEFIITLMKFGPPICWGQKHNLLQILLNLVLYLIIILRAPKSSLDLAAENAPFRTIESLFLEIHQSYEFGVYVNRLCSNSLGLDPNILGLASHCFPYMVALRSFHKSNEFSGPSTKSYFMSTNLEQKWPLFA